jgi:hypothetical protein
VGDVLQGAAAIVQGTENLTLALAPAKARLA